VSDKVHDLVIIGGGPAGLTAGIYASRGKLDCVLLEKMLPGGQVLYTDIVENYPGFEKPIKGPELAAKMASQAKEAGLAIDSEEAIKITALGKKKGFVIECASGKSYKALAVIAAQGAFWKKLGIPGEEEFRGKGVSYCATCDGPLFRNRDVVVVGGGDKALEESLYLAKLVNSLKLIHRRDRFRAVQEIQGRVLKEKKIVPVYNTVVTKINGKALTESIEILNKKTNNTETILASGIFIFIGIAPNSEALKGVVDMDEKGFVTADGQMKTSQEGIYACGDIIKKDLYQIVNAAGEGATAAFNAQKYIEELKGTAYPH